MALLAGAAAARPGMVSAQQRERVRRIGVLMGGTPEMTDQQAGLAVFMQLLHQLGWTEDRNVQVEIRWGGGDPARVRRYAEELVALPAEVIMTNGALPLEALLRATRSVPIIFGSVTDPVGSGFVESLARPGGNLTGFTNFEPSIANKWLEMVKLAAPNITRVAYLFNPNTAPLFYARAVETAAPLFSLKPFAAEVHDAEEMEDVIEQFARASDGALLVLPDLFTATNRQSIVAIAARHRLPAVYVDRILKGENPADLPVQAPTKYELVINLKTAKALGLKIPPTLLARADEVIE